MALTGPVWIDITIKDAYPLPCIDESLNQLAGSQWFSCLDLNPGHWQVETDLVEAQRDCLNLQ